MKLGHTRWPLVGMAVILHLVPTTAEARQIGSGIDWTTDASLALVRTDVGTTGAVRWDLGARREFGEEDPAKTWFLPGFIRAGTGGTAALDAARNPEGFRLSAAAGIAPQYLDVANQVDSGFFEFGAQFDVASDQRFDRVDAAVSLLGAYVNTSRGWWSFIPSAEGTWGTARALEAEVAAERVWRSRAAVDATWRFRAGDLPRIPASLSPFTLHLRLRAFRDGGDGGRTGVEEEGVFGAAALVYAVDRLGGSVFIRHSQGTLPTSLERPRAWSVGADLPSGWLRGTRE